MLDLVLYVALLVAAWRFLRRPHGPATRPLEDVPDAPPDAVPVLEPRFDDNGWATYSWVVPAARDEELMPPPR